MVLCFIIMTKESLPLSCNSQGIQKGMMFLFVMQVEDRRVVAEKKLISLNVQIEMLKEKCEIEKQQHHKLKVDNSRSRPRFVSWNL